jgi:hypothetical protein
MAERAAMNRSTLEQKTHDPEMIMATLTFNSAVAGHNETTDQPQSGFWNRFMMRLVERETAKARHQIALHLTQYSDEQLAKFGWTDQDIKRLRGGA